MRVIRWHGLPAVVRVATRGGVTVAVSPALSHGELLDLASLVLSGSEYREFCAELDQSEPGCSGTVSPSHGRRSGAAARPSGQ
jgi:hypothetical protein